ncbi:MAG TPA: FAD-dependent oxidoreductase [Burkholderiaceae bacterium]|nr:FAD-dependent oxidoreductase [Burkholderiaceae bacterium]
MKNCDFAIVGAGIAGASVGWRLAEHGRVLVLERESQPGYHSTGRSAAMFMESYGTAQIRALTRASRAFYEAPPPGFTEQTLLTPRGVLYIAQRGQEALLEEVQATLNAESNHVTRVDAAHVLTTVPVVKPDRLIGALAERDAMDIDVHALHQGFLRGLRRRGGEVLTNAELIGAQRDGALWSLRLSGNRSVQARALVNAAGAWADRVAQIAGAQPVGLQPKRRTAFTFAPPERIDCSTWPAVVGIDESYYFKPDAGQLLGSPANADPVEPHDVVPEELDVAIGIDRIQNATTLTIRRPRHAWAGLRSFVHDGDLVIGWDDRCDGFFWLAGQGGYGIQSAAGVAELAAALLLRADTPERLAAFGVDAQALVPARLR